MFGTLGSYTRVLHIVGKFAYRSVHGTSGLRACGCPASTVVSESWHEDVEPASYPFSSPLYTTEWPGGTR